ncbi:MAG: ribonuclease HII [Anaerolineales bacterium]|jgi:ribonuclease HII
MKPANHKPDWPDLNLEIELLNRGYRLIAGIDEAGRGAWAGPVAAGVIILPVDQDDLLEELDGVRDSKLLSVKQRTHWEQSLKKIALAWSVGMVKVKEVDSLGMIAATRLAMQRAIDGLKIPPEFLLIDHLLLPENSLPQTALPHGDVSVLSISSASILAKVARDRKMIAYDKKYPGYGFRNHKGYGTPEHQQALRKLGPSALHRQSFEPIAALMHAGSNPASS